MRILWDQPYRPTGRVELDGPASQVRVWPLLPRLAWRTTAKVPAGTVRP